MTNNPTLQERHSRSDAASAPVVVNDGACQAEDVVLEQRVFDLSLMQQQDEEEQKSRRQALLSQQENLRRAADGKVGVSPHHHYNAPPLESLIADDDNSSVSSVSTQGSIQRRSMFSQYWKKTGQEPPPYLPRSSSCGTSSPASISYGGGTAATAFSFLATPPEHEVVLDVQVPSMTAAATNDIMGMTTPSRRSMFGRGYPHPLIRQSSSAPSLSSYQCYSSSSFPDPDSTTSASATPSATTSLHLAAAASSPRKIRSCSQLLTSKQPSSSCLRESRFSPHKMRRNSSSTTTATATTSSATDCNNDSSSASIVSGSSCVRFDLSATSVRHYDLPQERYAEAGWSNYFE